MNEPHTRHDYGARHVAAARRVLVDLGQVLGSYFQDSIVVVGGWVPLLLLPGAEEPHVGSIDVDLALDATRLREGRYAEIVRSLLATGRYSKTEQQFKLRASVDLRDGGPVLSVDIDFLKPVERRRKRKGGRLLPDFRPLDAEGCGAAFVRPELVEIEGHTIAGAQNRVQVLVASIADFLVMKAYALAGRDRPKDAYDICYCLDHSPAGVDALAGTWRARGDDPLVARAVTRLREKFESANSYGPQQVAAFYDTPSRTAREMQVRRAFELVARFLDLIVDAGP